jgi:hypothetical protein
MPSTTIESISRSGQRLRLEFIWLGDRYGHRVSRIDASGAIQPLLESIEGSANDDWPPSPPLQSLTFEKLAGDRPVALLLGMAGNSHWSASMETVADQAALIFDLACRHAANPGHLGSRYRRLTVSADQFSIRGELASVCHHEGQIDLKPAAEAISGTTRWRFTLNLR